MKGLEFWVEYEDGYKEGFGQVRNVHYMESGAVLIDRVELGQMHIPFKGADGRQNIVSIELRYNGVEDIDSGEFDAG